MGRARVKALRRKITTTTIRGCRLTKRRILAIRRLISKSPGLSRTAISLKLCDKFGFRQQNGWPKDRAMRDILRRLEALNLIRLPESRKAGQNSKVYVTGLSCTAVDRTPITGITWDQLSLAHAKERDQCRMWDYLIDTHHYLGRKTIVGRNLRQLVYAGDRLVACLGWCDPSLKLAPRDGYLTRTFSNGWASVTHGVNNTRFLILPWVTVPNLASKILAIAKRDVRRYWQEYYSLELAWAETFVDPTRFAGTCYIAANWKKVGQTAGTARSGFSARREEHGIAKDIFVYVFREAIERAN
jgi:hypothetical protein